MKYFGYITAGEKRSSFPPARNGCGAIRAMTSVNQVSDYSIPRTVHQLLLAFGTMGIGSLGAGNISNIYILNTLRYSHFLRLI
jgi:hypothetical protein